MTTNSAVHHLKSLSLSNYFMTIYIVWLTEIVIIKGSRPYIIFIFKYWHFESIVPSEPDFYSSKISLSRFKKFFFSHIKAIGGGIKALGDRSTKNVFFTAPLGWGGGPGLVSNIV